MKRSTKRIIIYTCAVLIGLASGCAPVAREKINEVAGRHDAALVDATVRIKSADEKLATLPNPPAQITAAREDLGVAVTDVGVAQTEAGKLRALAEDQVVKTETLEESFFSVRQKKWAVGIGTTMALVGLALVLLRFGGWGGALAAIPVLGVILAKLGVGSKPS